MQRECENEAITALKPLSDFQAAVPELVAAAQKEYDKWDESDIDTYAGGGICHLIADALVEVFTRKGLEATTVASSHEQHVYVVFPAVEGVVVLDIPYNLYEFGGGYSWNKRAGIVFTDAHLVWDVVDADPSRYAEFIAD